MENFLYFYDHWRGMFSIIAGVYCLLIAYRKVPVKQKNPKTQLVINKRIEKLSPMLKFLAPFVIATGICELLGFF